jgi:hypothetical protein
MKIFHESNIEVYRLREFSNTHTWADIYIDAPPDAQFGAIMIRSDYGSWDYFWGSCGMPFKEFITSNMDKTYLIGKFMHGRNKEFREDYWQEEATKLINEAIASDGFDSKQGETLLEELNELIEYHDFKSADGLYAIIRESFPELDTFFQESDHYPKADYTPAQLTMFMEECWPAFIELLKAEVMVK